ncbi:MAG: NTP transferase domain-containing protein [Candidatus Nitrosotenuis sp.]
MIGLVMAGGKGSRMKIQGEKLLLEYKKPIVLHVIDALKNSQCFSKIVAATSPNSPNTARILSEHVQVISTKGNDYVSDLKFVLSQFAEPVFVTSGDLPLLDQDIVRYLVSKYQNKDWQSFVVTKKFLDENNLSLEYTTDVNGTICYYTGISIVNPRGSNKEDNIICDDKRIAVNLNTKSDYDLFQNS